MIHEEILGCRLIANRVSDWKSTVAQISLQEDVSIQKKCNNLTGHIQMPSPHVLVSEKCSGNFSQINVVRANDLARSLTIT